MKACIEIALGEVLTHQEFKDLVDRARAERRTVEAVIAEAIRRAVERPTVIPLPQQPVPAA